MKRHKTIDYTGEKESANGDLQAPTDMANEIFERYPREITVLLGCFMTHRLRRLYQAFDGDMLLPIILGEIAHHNITRLVAASHLRKKRTTIDWSAFSTWSDYEPCNALSVSEATGIPRETCRRKVHELHERGFIEHHPKGGYVVCQNVAGHFSEYNREAFAEWLVLADELQQITQAATRQMENEDDANGSAKKARHSSTQ